MTVEYFDESKTVATATTERNGAAGKESEEEIEGQKEVYSLRFPRIKHIWGAERDI